LILRTLTTENFRNLVAGEIAFHPQANLIVGRNGHGKTNLLEAIYFLATTKSFRTARVASAIRFDAASVFAAGSLQRFEIEKRLSIGLDDAKRRVLMINGEKVTLSNYLAAMSVFAFSSARLEILRGTPEERRRFLDRGIASLNPAYLDDLGHYARVLRQRNALLQSGNASALDAWNAELIAAGDVITKARAAYIEQLRVELASIMNEHRYHVTDVEMLYRPSAARDVEQLRRHELRARVTLAGPQRDRLEFVTSGRPAAEVLSGGEMKMIVLFLKFAKLELFRRRFDDAALFLLDDVDAELDLEILEKLLLRLPRETQVFATSAKERFLSALEAGPHRRLVIENGRVMAAHDFA